MWLLCFFFFQAEDGIRDLVRSRGLGDVYKRQLDFLSQEADDFVIGGVVQVNYRNAFHLPILKSLLIRDAVSAP